MKRTVRSKVLNRLGLVIGVMLVLVGSSFAATINVPEDYDTIQAAIDAAQPGDTVLVVPGRYRESIKLKPGVIVQGSGAHVTTLRGDGSYIVAKGWEYTVLGANDSTITGFTITSRKYKHSIFNHYCSPAITNNIIIAGGTGIFNWYSSPMITNNMITGGMGIYNFHCSTTITNNTIIDSLWGICNSSSSSVITNNLLTGEVGIRNYHSSPTITYNDIWVKDTDIINDLSSFPTVANNISADPIFVDPKIGDYHLQVGSPCIDAGTNAAPGLPGFDFDGNIRALDGDGDGMAIVDMGAYEYVKEVTPPPEEPNVAIELEELLAMVEDLDIPQGIANSLTSKLETALDKAVAALEDAETGDIEHAENMANAAVNKLEAFINAVEAQSGKKINVDHAAVLIGAAQSLIVHIKDILG